MIMAGKDLCMWLNLQDKSKYLVMLIAYKYTIVSKKICTSIEQELSKEIRCSMVSKLPHNRVRNSACNVSAVVSCTPPPGPCTSHSVPPLWPVC